MKKKKVCLNYFWIYHSNEVSHEYSFDMTYNQAVKQNLWEFAQNQFWHDDIPESRGQRGPLRIVDKSYDGSG